MRGGGRTPEAEVGERGGLESSHRPPAGRPSGDEDHADHSGRCVLEVDGERCNVMTSAFCHIPFRSPSFPSRL